MLTHYLWQGHCKSLQSSSSSFFFFFALVCIYHSLLISMYCFCNKKKAAKKCKLFFKIFIPTSDSNTYSIPQPGPEPEHWATGSFKPHPHPHGHSNINSIVCTHALPYFPTVTPSPGYCSLWPGLLHHTLFTLQSGQLLFKGSSKCPQEDLWSFIPFANLTSHIAFL